MQADQQSDNDLSRHRTVELDNGNKVNLERRDPYGFIHVWLDRGQFPDKSDLNGVFTTWDQAYNAVQRYLADRNAAVSEVRQVSVTSVKETVGEQGGVEVSQATPDFVIEKTKEKVGVSSIQKR